MEKISGIGPKGEDVWTEKHGKRSELLESIQRDGPRFAQNYLTLSCFLSRILYWLPVQVQLPHVGPSMDSMAV